MLSIIIPAYNEEAYIKNTLKGIENSVSFLIRNNYDNNDNNNNNDNKITKTKSNIAKLNIIKKPEVIVIANGCTDGTGREVKSYKPKSFKLKLIEIKENGVSKARNVGAKAAENELLVFLDADIIMCDDTLYKIYKLYEDYYSNHSSILNIRLIGSVYGKPNLDRFSYNFIHNWKNNRMHRGFYFGLVFCTKGLFSEIGGFDEGLNILEVRDFIKKAKKISGGYMVVDSYVLNNMRRYEKYGSFKLIFFWLYSMLFKTNRYPAVR